MQRRRRRREPQRRGGGRRKSYNSTNRRGKVLEVRRQQENELSRNHLTVRPFQAMPPPRSPIRSIEKSTMNSEKPMWNGYNKA